jgi:hypothetical protein
LQRPPCPQRPAQRTASIRFLNALRKTKPLTHSLFSGLADNQTRQAPFPFQCSAHSFNIQAPLINRGASRLFNRRLYQPSNHEMIGCENKFIQNKAFRIQKPDPESLQSNSKPPPTTISPFFKQKQTRIQSNELAFSIISNKSKSKIPYLVIYRLNQIEK